MRLFSLGRKNTDQLIAQAEQAVALFTESKTTLEKEKEQKMQRQVELWSVLTPSPELEGEYKKVSGEIAFTIQKMLVLEEFIKRLHLERFHCQQGKCKELEELLKIKDPTANLSPEVPSINF